MNPTAAALAGLLVTFPVALLTGTHELGLNLVMETLLRGVWIGSLIAPYILGGLLFWRMAARTSVGDGSAAAEQGQPGDSSQTPLARRRVAFFACFLVGPFAEAATGFGVGMLGTVMLVRPLGFASRHLMMFALLSQILIPWGGMGGGTLVAAAYARISPELLGLYTLIPVCLLMGVWLALFWRTSRSAGISAPWSECAREVAWVAAGMGLLALTTAYLGPETALLAAYGPLIVTRYLMDRRPDAAQALAALRKVLPYAVLIVALSLSRLVPPLKTTLVNLGKLSMYADLPAWSPLFHAGTFLVAGALITAAISGHSNFLATEARSAWATGKHAVMTVFVFAMMAELLAASGISGAFASATFQALGKSAVLITPVLSGGFGMLTNSGNPPNSLFLPSQVALALQAGLSVPAVAAIQHASGMSMGFFSPVRMAIAANLAGAQGHERAIYRELWPFALVALALLTAVAAVFIHLT
jgi:lactate permease